jgi:hypothetical protein
MMTNVVQSPQSMQQMMFSAMANLADISLGGANGSNIKPVAVTPNSTFLNGSSEKSLGTFNNGLAYQLQSSQSQSRTNGNAVYKQMAVLTTQWIPGQTPYNSAQQTYKSGITPNGVKYKEVDDSVSFGSPKVANNASITRTLEAEIPKSWDASKVYKPGDSVSFNGTIYQAPSGGSAQAGVQPGTDDRQWLYAGTVDAYQNSLATQARADDQAVVQRLG